MNKKYNAVILIAAVIFVLGLSPVIAGGQTEKNEQYGELSTGSSAMTEDQHEVTAWTGGNGETAVFAGGCFWGVEAVFESLKGVQNAVSGYSGGEAETAKYKAVGTGTTGHAEAVLVEYDPEIIDYETLLEVFFTVAHDPTQLGYQGPDVGSEYRSVIFYTDSGQKQAVEKIISKLESSNLYSDPIVTEVVPLDAFYPAEDYHQNFLVNNPSHPYIVFWDLPKIERLEEAYPELVTEN